MEDFEAAALPHLADLYRSASLLVQNSPEAEDLVQEVYLEAWKSFHRFEPGTNCRAWLFKILFHRLHHLRRRLIKTSKLEAFATPADEDNLMAEPPIPQEIQDDDILRALERVPLEFREVVLGRCGRVFLQRNRRHPEDPSGHGDVPAEPSKKAVAAGTCRGSGAVRYRTEQRAKPRR